jgi:HAE1 family hydrophobic/amphiphilic exporter-1
MTTLVMLAILLAGVVGYQKLPVNDLPNVDFPTLAVSASLPGASPDTMASSVATPLEKQFSTIAGITSMTSVSSQSSSSITLQFSLDRDIDAAAQDVQTAISQSIRDLPNNMPSPPSYRKVNPADSPILFLALSSEVLPLSEVDEYAQTYVAQRISMVSGVAQVQVYGSQKYAVRVQVDPQQLATRQIGIDEVIDAVQGGNTNLPTGNLQGQNRAYTIESKGQLLDAKSYEPVVISWRNGAPVRVADVGRAIDSVENDRSASWYKDSRAVVLAVQRQPGTNTIEIVDNIRKLMPQFQEQLPAAVTLNVLYDRTVTIRESVHDVNFTLVLTIGLVVLVIFLFLRNVAATLIPALALILSVIGTFAAMYLLGFSLNNLSLMALTLAVGLVVDDAIVMVENIIRHMEDGEDAMEAAKRGSAEIGFTILSMTVSLVAVFIPVVFMSGIVGRLLNEFAITIAVALLISGVVSLTQTPMLCARFLKPYAHKKHGVFYNALEYCFDLLLKGYEKTLKLSLRFHVVTMLTLPPLIVLSGYLFGLTPRGFLPAEDNGQILAITEGLQGISFRDMVKHQQEVAKIFQANPHIHNFMSAIGAGGPNSPGGNGGRIFANLKPKGERPPLDVVMAQLRKDVSGIPGIRVFMQNRPAIQIGGQITKSLYQFTLQSTNTAELYGFAPKLEALLKEEKGFRDVTSDLLITNPQVEINVDRDKAASLGISVQEVENALFTAYGTRQVSTIYAPNNQYRVIVELLPAYLEDPEAINLLYVRSDQGALVPLNTLATITETVGPLTVTHLGQFPAVTISFNLDTGFSLGDAVSAVNRVAKDVLPASITTSFQGTAQAFEDSFRGLSLLIIAAVVVIYIVLGMLYESFIHPITILSGLPAAAVGALATLLYFGKELNLFSMVGIIMLIGIVKKNAIMMIDFALEAQREKNMAPADAIYDACVVRFRPIMMTTMAALMGTLPIAVGYGAGSESRQPLGLAVVGGLIVSQLLTLYITPVFYIYMERLTALFRRKRVAPPEAVAAAK